jgi:abortive infection bacteriophage resistance protein
MLYTKPALTYEKQVELLKSRGLNFDDEEVALHCLKRIGYFRLSAYFVPFKISGQDRFASDATFRKILDLYQFDARLRLLAMQAIDHIEVSVRASLTYKLGHESGPFGYVDPSILLHSSHPRARASQQKGLTMQPS